MHVEALNGINGPTFTTFPTAIALAASWDPAAVSEMAALTRQPSLTPPAAPPS